MKFLFCLFAMVISLRGQEVAVEKAPPEVIASAVKAVADLGQEVVLGRYKVAVDRMYPQWKERTAMRMGGMENLERQLDGVAKQMLQQGISITDFTPQGQPRAFEVFPGKKVETIDGRQVESLRYTKWLVLVPTVTRFRTMIEGDPVAVVIESTGFQVAISEKGKDSWTFIDGAGVTVNDLRSLFITLPKDLELPPLEKRQIR
ncbi:hypothetical protein ACFSSA_13650 [Luteolibacter algae]|uniref:Uncharacterized protein n=2 Tax=Luteolibacter algae TaxID=454151 RepID=A0ABW5DAT5_9BACT